MSGPWIGKGARERDRKGVVCAKFPLTVTKEFQMKKEESEKDKSHDFAYL